MRITMVIIILFTIQTWQSSFAGSGWKNNVHLLPQYCQDRLHTMGGANPGLMKKLKNNYGGMASHLHHYCSGIYSEIKAKSASREHRKGSLYNVVHQMEYVSGACGPKCVFYPEIHTRWGWALAKQGNIGEAIKHYQLAFQARPDYIPAYTRLSRVYLKNNQPAEARKVLELGLKANPKSRALIKRLKKMEPSS